MFQNNFHITPIHMKKSVVSNVVGSILSVPYDSIQIMTDQEGDR